MLYRPTEVNGQSRYQVRLCHIEERAVGARIVAHIPQMTIAKIHWHSIWIKQSLNDVIYFDRLEEQYGCHHNQHLIWSLNKRNQEQSENCVGAKYVTIEKHQVEHSPSKKQQHSPCKAQAEVLTTFLCIMVLDIAAQSEQQCKDSIHLARTNIEHCIPQSLVESRWFGEGIEIQMFEEMNDNDAHNGKSAKAINNVNALWLDALFHYLLI